MVVEKAGVCCSQQTISPEGKAHLHHQHLESPSLAHGFLERAVVAEEQGGGPRRPHTSPRIQVPTHADGGALPCPRNQAVAQVMEFMVC